MNKKVEEQITDRIHQLLIDDETGEYINYVRDRFTDEELLIAYKLGLKERRRKNENRM